jgi:hypothetical protein
MYDLERTSYRACASLQELRNVLLGVRPLLHRRWAAVKAGRRWGSHAPREGSFSVTHQMVDALVFSLGAGIQSASYACR